jgi:alkylation response protein AidB-like acyl-CoA dehydrogenase
LPLVRKMDDDHKFDDGVVKKLFENGLMGVEADPEFGGSGCNFLTMMLVCEELSKVKNQNLMQFQAACHKFHLKTDKIVLTFLI